MIKTKLEIMEEIHNQTLGGILITECEIQQMESKVIIILPMRDQDAIRQQIAQKKSILKNTQEILEILKKKIAVEDKIIIEPPITQTTISPKNT